MGRKRYIFEIESKCIKKVFDYLEKQNRYGKKDPDLFNQVRARSIFIGGGGGVFSGRGPKKKTPPLDCLKK